MVTYHYWKLSFLQQTTNFELVSTSIRSKHSNSNFTDRFVIIFFKQIRIQYSNQTLWLFKWYRVKNAKVAQKIKFSMLLYVLSFFCFSVFSLKIRLFPKYLIISKQWKLPWSCNFVYRRRICTCNDSVTFLAIYNYNMYNRLWSAKSATF